MIVILYTDYADKCSFCIFLSATTVHLLATVINQIGSTFTQSQLNKSDYYRSMGSDFKIKQLHVMIFFDPVTNLSKLVKLRAIISALDAITFQFFFNRF